MLSKFETRSITNFPRDSVSKFDLNCENSNSVESYDSQTKRFCVHPVGSAVELLSEYLLGPNWVLCDGGLLVLLKSLFKVDTCTTRTRTSAK